jgi:iron complex outermembrane receptor protein
MSTQRLSNAEVTTYDAWLLARMRAGEGSVDALANETSRIQGVPTLALVPSREARARFDRTIGGVHALVPWPGAERSTLEMRTAVLVARTDYRDPLDELALQARRLVLTGERVDQRLAAHVGPTHSLDVDVSVDASTERLSRDADGVAALRAQRLQSRGALGARQRLGDALSVEALGAVECDASSPRGASACDSVSPAGRFGAAWTSRRWDVFANVGRYVRVPTLGELYGVSPVVRGNSALREESGVTLDVGARVGARRFGPLVRPQAAAFGFVRFSDGLISYVRSSQGFAEPMNVASARVAGIEAQVGTGIGEWLSAQVIATILDPRDTSADRKTVNDVLPFQSRFVVSPKVAADWRAPAGRPFAGFVGRARLEARWLYQTSRYADAAGLAVMPSQSSLDVEVLVESTDGAFALRLRGADLLDVARFDVVGFPLPGRSFFLSLETSR